MQWVCDVKTELALFWSKEYGDSIRFYESRFWRKKPLCSVLIEKVITPIWSSMTTWCPTMLFSSQRLNHDHVLYFDISSLHRNNCWQIKEWKLLRTWYHNSVMSWLKSSANRLIEWLIFGVLTPLSAIFQLYHGDQF